MSVPERRAALELGGTAVPPGRRRRIEVHISRLPTGTSMSLPVLVLHGMREGPAVWLSAAVHGDELNGVEIIRQVLERLNPRALAGTVIAVPIVNVFGFITESRYLPDRRDLNRSFPGSRTGSLAARIAHLLMHEVVERCDYGIDLHTGSGGRTNLPHVRADLNDPETRRFAEAFGAACTLHARTRDGSLREAASRLGKHVLLFEGGESSRLDRWAIRAGVQGILRALAALEMISASGLAPAGRTFRPASTQWLRSNRSGILHLSCELGAWVDPRDALGLVVDTLGERAHTIRSPSTAMVLAKLMTPLVNRGDAILHLAIPGDHPAPPAPQGSDHQRDGHRDADGHRGGNDRSR